MEYVTGSGSVELDGRLRVRRLTFVRFGNPGELALNSKLTVVRLGRRASIKPTSAFEALMNGMAYEIRGMLVAVHAKRDAEACYIEGPVMATMTVHWPRRYAKRSPAHLRGLPFGDVDACHKAMFDVAEKSKLVEDDGQIIEEHTRKRFDKGRPRITIAYERTDRPT